jgi:uracil-DNA glycosylase
MLQTFACGSQFKFHFWASLRGSCVTEAVLTSRMERHLIEEPGGRTRSRAKDAENAAPLIPARPTISKLQQAARGCQACPLWKTGTQTVFGEGSREAKVVFVGEQPGNDEDLAGKPFVGPAGKLLDKALVEAGIDRGEVYVTNVVKHFKWEPQGKRRIHKKPNAREIAACRPWLDAELDLLKPEVVVCLGATAAQALLGRDFKVSQRRGEFVDSKLAGVVAATVHPSSILRAPDDETRHQEMKKFISDLKKVAKAIQSVGAAKWERFHSEAIKEMRYHREFNLLDVHFTTEKIYRYPKVEPAEFRELTSAPSIGTYFNKTFKAKHPHSWVIRR